ncbi:glutathione hydrolase 1 proenzyme-like [Liolophura sinensis]|uniref:glutathione hydrolase 1 proenzyme-like n=1 Tax=Liolophura sinensis TaxID=3198878 RepID=UPI0031594121
MSYMSLEHSGGAQEHAEQNEPLLDDYTEDDDFVEEAKRRVKWKQHKRRCKMAILLLGFLIVATCVVVVPILLSHDWPKGRNILFSNSVLGEYKHAAVASDVTQCSNIGKDILEQGGSAVDAAVASLFCMGLTDPQSMGIGGGFLMTVYNRSTESTVIIDAREVAPAAANETMFVDDPKLGASGPLSIGVPGEIKGYWEAHLLFGRLPWEQLVKPTVTMAVDGFTVPASLAEALEDDKTNILNDPQLRKVYLNPTTNELYKTGEHMKYPQLGETLKSIAKHPMGFYTGKLMKDIAQELSDKGSIITEEDMKNYTVRLREPSVTELRSGLRVVSPPPPGSGPVLEFILQILDGYSFTTGSLDPQEAVVAYHRIIEAFKFAYAKRTYLGDEDFVDVKELVANLTSRDFADQIRLRIWDNQTHNTEWYGPVWEGRVKTGTAHLSVVAQNGDAVSVTSTINSRFGSLVMGEKTGIIYNNEMDDFSSPNVTNGYNLPPSPANFIRAGKRPLSSMCPAIVLSQSGEVMMAVGAAGGSRITTTTAMVMAYVLWFGDNIKQAIDERRLHHQLLPAQAYYEQDFPQEYVTGLEKLGHNMTWQKLGESIVQGIVRENGVLQANSDFRKGGTPAGY